MKRNTSSQRPQLRHTIRLRLTLFVFLIMLISGILTALVYFIILSVFPHHPAVLTLALNPLTLAVLLLCISAAIGTALSGILGKFYLRPLKQLIRGTEEVKKGNFKIQLTEGSNPVSEMGHLIESFNEMTRELDGIELFRNDFINNFSHEFKTPIVSIRGFARELQHEGLDARRCREYAEIIAEEADRLVKLSSNILELSRLENQQIVTDRVEFELDEQLRRCILLQEEAWSEKEIEMLPELSRVRYVGNEELMAHIWNNLISNAIKFTPRNGIVGVRLLESEKAVTVEVSDSGPGMSEEVISHIFEKFYQGDPSHHAKGYGIGLTMAHRAAVLCGGEIEVESKLGEGSVFRVKLKKTAG